MALALLLLEFFGVIAQLSSKSPNRFRVSHIATTRTTDPRTGRSLRSPQLRIRRNKLSTWDSPSAPPGASAQPCEPNATC